MRNEKVWLSAGIFLFVIMIIINMPFGKSALVTSGFNSITGMNETTQTLYITLDDESIGGNAKKFPANVTLAINHYVNTTIANKTLVSCVFDLLQTKNSYDNNGNLNYTQVIAENVDYNYSVTSYRRGYQMFAKDTMKTELRCFWDSEVDDSIFQYLDPAIASIVMETDTYYCDLCVRGNQPIVTDYIDIEKTSGNYLIPFNRGKAIIGGSMTIITILYWVIKIFALLFLAGLTFGVGIWFYSFLSKLIKK